NTKPPSRGSNRSPDRRCARRGKESCEIIEMHSSSRLWATLPSSEFLAGFGGAPRNIRKRKRRCHPLLTKQHRTPPTDRKAPRWHRMKPPLSQCNSHRSEERRVGKW